MNTPTVSIILVNWNRCQDICENIACLRDVKDVACEIIVVDNGSTDGSQGILSQYPDIRLVCLEDNLGPAAARNAGSKVAQGDYLFFLDSDAFLRRPMDLKCMVERMDGDPTVGILACQVLKDGSEDIDQWIYAQDPKEHRELEFQTYSFSAAGALIRAEAVKKEGGFWDELFIYNEEVELSLRLIRAGYQVLYFPGARVYHRSSPMGRQSVGNYLRLQIRNWIWIFCRHYPPLEGAKRIALYSGVYLLKGVTQMKLWDCIKGIAAGLSKGSLLLGSQDKLTHEQIQQLKALNPRKHIRLGR